MKNEKEEKLFRDEFVKELLDDKKTEEIKEIGDSELFGAEIGENEHENRTRKQEKEPEHALDIIEHGRKIKVPKAAAMDFAKAMGKDVGEIIDIYQKGFCFDELMRRFMEAKRDADAIEKIAGIRGIGKEEIKVEILGVLEKARLEKTVAAIEEANPGMNRETAEELAKFRIAAAKPFKEEKSRNPKEDKIREKIREIDLFMANHASEGIDTLDNSVLDEWEGGIPLEKAFGNYLLMQENKKLMEEIENMKKEKAMDDQRSYAKEHSSGSVSSHAVSAKLDEFIEGLFREY